MDGWLYLAWLAGAALAGVSIALYLVRQPKEKGLTPCGQFLFNLLWSKPPKFGDEGELDEIRRIEVDRKCPDGHIIYDVWVAPVSAPKTSRGTLVGFTLSIGWWHPDYRLFKDRELTKESWVMLHSCASLPERSDGSCELGRSLRFTPATPAPTEAAT